MAPIPKNILQDGDFILDNNEMLFDPYNPNNKEITLSDVQSILINYGITAKVNNLNLFKRAFIHRSYVKRPELENQRANISISEQPPDCLPLKTKSNERLEFIGDGVACHSSALWLCAKRGGTLRGVTGGDGATSTSGHLLLLIVWSISTLLALAADPFLPLPDTMR